MQSAKIAKDAKKARKFSNCKTMLVVRMYSFAPFASFADKVLATGRATAFMPCRRRCFAA